MRRIVRGGDGGVAPRVRITPNAERILCGRGFRRSKRDRGWIEFSEQLIETDDRSDVAHDYWEGSVRMGRLLAASELGPAERSRARPRMYPPCYMQRVGLRSISYESVYERTDEAQRRLAAEGIDLGGTTEPARPALEADLYTRPPAPRTIAEHRAECMMRLEASGGDVRALCRGGAR